MVCLQGGAGRKEGCSLRRRFCRMHCKSCWTRSADLVRNDHQKSHRTHRQSWPIAAHRVNNCSTQINNKRGSISPGIMVIPFYKLLAEKSLKKNCFSVKKKIRNSEQRSTDLSELMVIDEMAQCRVCEEHNAIQKSLCTVQ